MKSSRATVEQIDKLAKMFGAVKELAEDHSDIAALERHEADLNRSIAAKKEEAQGLDARIQAVKDQENAVAELQRKANELKDNILTSARQTASKIITEAESASKNLREQARADGEIIKKSYTEQRQSVEREIEAKRQELSGINAEIAAAKQDYEKLKGHISEANAQIANLIKMTTVK